ncbi:dolichyl-P-Man:Man(5)GlcNAc(2)-PP-dolichol alpha-1,3-mannosyltransferase [Trapelia coarctata]|nr:dolichyl-P-Man:Man(5)GlcNAc(2)-PP-dolichol alpha-1,3-mannosyltransferase [Trapelia coarctata]
MERTQALYHSAIDLATNPKHTRWLCPLLLVTDAVLCALIIWKVPYTEIDYSTYMVQVSQYLAGERDYTLIEGPTGPLVYPAAHLYIYSALSWLTTGGRDIWPAQWVFGGVYLGVLAVVMGCYAGVEAPPYLFPLLILSKRLHSLFVLRLFNDCFAAGALFIAIYAYQKRMWTLGSIAFSLGVGVKMSLLLALPGVVMVLGQGMEVNRALRNLAIMAQIQALLAVPFLPVNARGYISRAFEFTRRFLFKWTVNWRFVGEDTFLSSSFAQALAFANLGLLAIFVLTRWTGPSGLSVPDLLRRVYRPLPARVEQQISLRVTPDFVMTTILSSLAIGMLCARSLHYQFYAYIAWATPFLLWKSGLHPGLIYLVWAAQEWAWNVYPSTDTSSKVVIGCLAVQVIGTWWGTRNDLGGEKRPVKKGDEHTHID